MNNQIEILKKLLKFQLQGSKQQIFTNGLEDLFDKTESNDHQIIENGSLLETLQFYQLNKEERQNEVLLIIKDIYNKIKKSPNKLRDGLLQMSLNSSKISPRIMENQKKLMKEMIGPEDELETRAYQNNVQKLEKNEKDFEIELESPYDISIVNFEIYTDIQIDLLYKMKQLVCGYCGEVTNSYNLVDLYEENSKLADQKLLIVIQNLNIYIDYQMCCACLLPGTFYLQINSDFIKPIIYNYSHIKFNSIKVDGYFDMTYHLNVEQFYIEIQLNSYLKQLETNYDTLKYIKFIHFGQVDYLGLLIIDKAKDDELFQQNEQSQKCFQKLKNIQISQIEILTIYDLNFNECQEFIESNHMVRIKNIIDYEKFPKIAIINKRYSLYLSIFTYYKLFYSQFSIFRTLYDLYENI